MTEPAPTQGNVEIVQSAFDAWDRGDTDAILELCDEDQSGRSKDTGIGVAAQFTFLFTLRAGKITEWRIFLRESEAAVRPSA